MTHEETLSAVINQPKWSKPYAMEYKNEDGATETATIWIGLPSDGLTAKERLDKHKLEAQDEYITLSRSNHETESLLDSISAKLTGEFFDKAPQKIINGACENYKRVLDQSISETQRLSYLGWLMAREFDIAVRTDNG
jgi:hypothetical protein